MGVPSGEQQFIVCALTTESNGEASNEVNSLDKDNVNEEENATNIPTDIMRNSVSGKTTTNPLTQPVVDDKQTDFVLDEHVVTLVSSLTLEEIRIPRNQFREPIVDLHCVASVNFRESL